MVTIGNGPYVLCDLYCIMVSLQKTNLLSKHTQQEVYPTWFAWIYVLATPEVAESYVCEITAKSAEEIQQVLRTVYTGPINGIDITKRDIR